MSNNSTVSDIVIDFEISLFSKRYIEITINSNEKSVNNLISSKDFYEINFFTKILLKKTLLKVISVRKLKNLKKIL